MLPKSADSASDARTKTARKAEVGGQAPDESRIVTNKRSKRRLGNEPGRTIKILVPKKRSNDNAAYDHRSVRAAGSGWPPKAVLRLFETFVRNAPDGAVYEARAIVRLFETFVHNAPDDADYDDPAILRSFEDFLRDAPQAILRLRAHRLLRVSLWDGVDVVASRARALFDAVPAEVLSPPDGASGRERFQHALHVTYFIVMLAYMFGQKKDIEKMFLALQAGLFAVYERDRGFDEPFLRARRRSPRQSRESHFVRLVKAAAAEACEALIQFGVKDAASQVAEILNRNHFLPIKANGKAVVPKSVLNWRSRFLTGDLWITWMSEEGASLFPNAYRLFRDGRLEAARRRVLRFLPIYIETERRGLLGEINPPS
jgi:hypothetical protein